MKLSNAYIYFICFITFCLFTVIFISGCESFEEKKLPSKPNSSITTIPHPTSRPFLMGFTRWPSDLTAEGLTIAQNFAHAHGDIVSVMFIGGVPWHEAAENKPFSRDLQNHFSYRPPAGKKLFLSTSPLNMGRDGLAPYWGESDNLPLPAAWKNLALNDPLVKKAFLAFNLRAIEAMHPDYLAIGIESNILITKSATKWAQLKELHRDTYLVIKKKYPNLPVFFTTEVLHYLKLNQESKHSNQQQEVDDLMQYSDVFAMSFYPHMSYEVERPVASNFLDFSRRFKKPIAISESGITSRDVTLKSFHITLYGSEDEQVYFENTLLESASKDNYLFVINFATTDFEKLSAKLPPPSDDFSRIWAYTGLQNSSQVAKPALAIWDAYFNATYHQN